MKIRMSVEDAESILDYHEFYRYDARNDEEVDDFKWIYKKDDIFVSVGSCCTTFDDGEGNTNWNGGCVPKYVTLDVTEKEYNIISELARNAGIQYETTE